MRREDYIPRFGIGEYVTLNTNLGDPLVVRIIDIKPRFNEVYGIPTYHIFPPLAYGGQEEVMCPMLDASFRKATEQEILLFYKGEYDHQSTS